MDNVSEFSDLTRASADAEACPVPSAAEAPGDDALAALFSNAVTCAVVGASPNPERTSHQIALWLMENTPYELYLVNPAAKAEEIRGHGFYSSLAELPVAPDIVDVFRRPEHTPAIAADAVAVGAGALWLQLGISNAEAAQIAADGGLTVVQNRCIKVEYRRLSERITHSA